MSLARQLPISVDDDRVRRVIGEETVEVVRILGLVLGEHDRQDIEGGHLISCRSPGVELRSRSISRIEAVRPFPVP